MTWRTETLGECCDIVSGATPRTNKPEYWDGDVLWITPKDLGDFDGIEVFDTSAKITQLGLASCAARVLPKGAVLLSSRAPIGHMAIVGKPMATNQGFKSLVPKPYLDSRYLYRFLQFIKPQIISMGRGATFKEVSKQIVAGVKISFPPLPEQKRIAAILDKADAIRRKREKAIELTDSFLRSVFVEMFGKNDTPTQSIRELLSDGTILLHKDGNFGSSYPRADEFGETGVPFLTARCFTDSGELIRDNVQYLNEEKASTLGYGWINADDVLLAHNATVGRVALYRGEYERALVGTSLTIYRPNKSKLLPEYLVAALRSSLFQAQLKKNMSQTTRNQVPITAQRELKIAVPSIESQCAFSEVANKVLSLSVRLAMSEKKASELAQSLSGSLLAENRPNHSRHVLSQEAYAL